MAITSTRDVPDRRRDKRRRDKLRYWLAAILGIAAAVGAAVILSRDVAWRSRSRDAIALAETAEANGKYTEARIFYEEALGNNPYDFETHYAFAEILNHRLNEHEYALSHYLHALAYSPREWNAETAIKREINILRLMQSGELEDPNDAIEEMFRCVEGSAKFAFLRRLEIQHRNNRNAYWEGWKKRGRGSVASIKITSNHEGFYNAAVELRFPDDTTMLLHLLCPLRDIWRLSLSFP